MKVLKTCGSALLLFAVSAASFAANEEITYAKHISPIFQDKCQECHQPNSIAPVSFMDYRDVLKEAQSIKAKVESRVMPPWHIDTSVGIQDFKNDRGLSDEEIDTIVGWVDNGAPMGDPADMPPPRAFPDPTAWQLAKEFGKPDLLVKSEPYTLAAETQDKWFRPVVDAGVTEPRWVKAVEIKPSYPEGRQVVHHTLTYLIQEEDGVTGLASSAEGVQRSGGMFMEWAVGKVGEIFPPDAGKLLLPGVKFRWEVHYHAIGKEVRDDQVEMGIWFYPRDHVPQNRTVLRYFDITHGGTLDIPPGEMAVSQQYYVLAAPARLENFQPHMHMRGKAMRMEAVYPDGRTELLNQVSNFQWNWHINYVYEEDAAPLLPKGTTLIFTAWHDNTEDNPHNPDPEQWVGWGDRTVDEMAHAWVDVTYLEQEDYERMTAERAAGEENGR